MITDSKPHFIIAVSEDGKIPCRWAPFDAQRAWLIVSLRDADSFNAKQFWSGDVDSDLIRFPVDSSSGSGTVYAPAGRGVALTLVARDADDARVHAPPVRLGATHTALPLAGPAALGAASAALSSAPAAIAGPVALVAEFTVGPAAEFTPPPRLEAPLEHGPGAHAVGDSPFVFVRAPGAALPPDLSALAARVARVAQGGAPDSHIRRSPQPAAAFGTRQKWYLTRLRWSDHSESEGSDAPSHSGTETSGPRPHVAVVRDHYIDGSVLDRWAHRLPDDAISLPPGADGLIDGRSEADRVHFYAILQGPAPWTPLVVSPAPPPFHAVQRPFVLGDAEPRLGQAVDQRLHALEHHPVALKELPVVLAALQAAVAWLPRGSPLRRRVAQAVARITQKEAF